MTTTEHEQDAKMLAANELYEALKRLVEYIEVWSIEDDFFQFIRPTNEARLALRKAEGK